MLSNRTLHLWGRNLDKSQRNGEQGNFHKRAFKIIPGVLQLQKTRTRLNID